MLLSIPKAYARSDTKDLVFFSLSSFIVVLITCLSRAESFNSASFVWANFSAPEGGWTSPVVVFLTGMSNPNFMFAGIDGAIHLAEECTNASRTVPRALFSTICVGFITAFPFAIAMLYTLTDFAKVTEDATGYYFFPHSCLVELANMVSPVKAFLSTKSGIRRPTQKLLPPRLWSRCS